MSFSPSYPQIRRICECRFFAGRREFIRTLHEKVSSLENADGVFTSGQRPIQNIPIRFPNHNLSTS